MSERKYGYLYIRLKSDLCVHSGFSSSNVVDRDICFDSLGLPYIPSKRIKGCLKEAGELIRVSQSHMDDLFGAWGETQVGSLLIENAILWTGDNDSAVWKELTKLSREKGWENFVNSKNVLELFTRVKAQTSIVNDRNKANYGTADDSTLRFTRIINQYFPRSGELDEIRENVFYAKISFPSELESVVKDIVSALKNIGLYRNRGLGSVCCTIGNLHEMNCGNEEYSMQGVHEYEGDQIKVLRYRVINDSPLMLAGQTKNISEKYISGQKIIGCLAAECLRKVSGQDVLFRELFLTGRCQYSNLYPVDSYPCPMFLRQMKIDKKRVVNRACIDAPEPRYENDSEKMIKNKFAALCDNNESCTFALKDVDMEISYHHSRKEENEGLYSLEVISAGQVFEGKITGPESLLNQVEQLLLQCALHIGQSKGVQYGKCHVDGQPVIEDISLKHYKKGTHLVMWLQSDGIFDNHITGYTVSFPEVQDMIRTEMEKCGAQLSPVQDGTYETCNAIRTKEIVGYYGVWNLKKPSVQGIAAGSVFTYELLQDASLPETVAVGVRTGEGYGQLRILDRKSLIFEQTEQKERCMEENNEDPAIEAAGEISRLLCRKYLEEQLLEKALKHSNKLNITAASLGQIILMLEEAYKENPANPVKAYSVFIKKIGTIKDSEKKKRVLSYIESLTGKANDAGKLDITKLEIEHAGKYVRQLFGDRTEAVYAGLWYSYVLSSLTLQKYGMKQESHDGKIV